MSKEEKKRGRPVGSKTEPAPVVLVEKSRCPSCNSINRSPYSNTRTFDYAVLVGEQEYTKVVWRHCWCIDCGQHRIDKSYE